MVAAYVIHVIDESLLGGSFVEKFSNNGGRDIPGKNSSGLTPRQNLQFHN
jgi:hypothetical protein